MIKQALNSPSKGTLCFTSLQTLPWVLNASTLSAKSPRKALIQFHSCQIVKNRTLWVLLSNVVILNRLIRFSSYCRRPLTTIMPDLYHRSCQRLSGIWTWPNLRSILTRDFSQQVSARALTCSRSRLTVTTRWGQSPRRWWMKAETMLKSNSLIKSVKSNQSALKCSTCQCMTTGTGLLLN